MIFQKSEYNILKLIYENPGIKLSELIKKARVSAETAKKRLTNFINSGIIIEKKIIGGKKVLLKNFFPNLLSEEGKNIFSLIESEKRQDFFKKNKALVGPFKQLLKNTGEKIKIILIFGSFASFSNEKDSDLDIIFLADENITENEKEILKKEIERAFVTFDKEISPRIDIIANFKNNLDKRIYETIIKNHIIIRGSMDYLEMIKSKMIS